MLRGSRSLRSSVPFVEESDHDVECRARKSSTLLGTLTAVVFASRQLGDVWDIAPRCPAESDGCARESRFCGNAAECDRLVPGWRSQPHRHVGSETGRTARDSEFAWGDPNERSWDDHQRALSAD